MKRYKHILLATDLQEQSKLVADRAKELADFSSAKLSIVHVLEPVNYMYGGGELAIPIDAEVDASLQNEAQQKLDKLAKKLEISKKHQHLEFGSTKKTICELAIKLDVDLIVLGSHDNRWVALFLGSTADAVLHSVPCDIFVVKV